MNQSLLTSAATVGLLWLATAAGAAGAPTVADVEPPPGTVSALTFLTLTFSEPVQGVSDGDLLIDGFPADTIAGGPQTYTFTFAQPAPGAVDITWAAGHGITDYGTPPNSFNAAGPGATWQYLLLDDEPPTVAAIAPPAGQTIRVLRQIEVRFSEVVTGVTVGDLLINAEPATNLTTLPGGRYVFHFPQPAAGPVQVAWAETNGIQDFGTPPNALVGGSWSYVLDADAPPPDLVLNEILASNRNGLRDETGVAEDWIEIWNRGTNAVNLAGWSLSDDAALPGKWVFPAYTLRTGQYLVVFASGNDLRAPTGTNKFHTNFKLDLLGEDLGLYSPDAPRELAAGVAGRFPEQRNDHSFGLDPGGNLRYFATPTPGEPNGESTIAGVVEPVHFSVRRGYFDGPFTLVLTTPTPNARIRYTTDGSEPTATTGRPYQLPLTLTNTTLLRAAAFRADALPSLVGTHSYLFNLTAAFRSLPVISLVADTNDLWGPTGILGINGGNYTAGPWAPNTPGNTNEYHNPQQSLKVNEGGPAWERAASLEWIEADNEGFQSDLGLRVHGSSYTRPRYKIGDKFSFKVFFRGDYGASRLEYPWFPESVDTRPDEVVLRDGHNDGRNPFIVDELVRRLHHDMGQAAVLGTFGNLLLNGQPMFQSGQAENFYFNPVSRVKEGFLQAAHGGGEAWDIIGPFGDFQGGGDRVNWNAFESFMRNQGDTTQSAWYEEAGRRLDLVNFADYLLVNIYGATWDWPHNNWRAARERTPSGRWRFYVWDAEGAFYTHSTRSSVGPSYNNFTDTSQGLADNEEIATFYQKLRGNAEFRLLFADRIQKHFFNSGALTEARITDRFNEMKTLLAGVIASMDSRIINNWVPERRTHLWTQFASQGLLAPINVPAFNQHGGPVARGFQLTMTGPAGSTIYFTTNGTDPRMQYTGAVAAGTLTYVAGQPVTLQQSVLVKARARSGASWSALTEAAFDVGFRGVPLRITEIMYHPAGGNSAHEFLELQNMGAAPLDVGGFTFAGITFTFPFFTVLAPGAVVVLASDNDPAAFADRYPDVLVDGYFAGSLANGGERIAVLDREGQIIVSVDYQDGDGWPERADGYGGSLEIIDPLGDPDAPANWRASFQAGGSPGAANAPPATATVRLNEIMADNLSAVSNGHTFPDWIELRNAGAVESDVSGWSLSDDGDARKFVFPAGTVIPANGYLVVWCDAATNTTPGLHAGFALDRDGESVFLYNAVTSRVDAVSFGMQLPDYAIGRIGSHWTLSAPTPGAPNTAAPMAAATNLNFNEWLANPVPGEDDWVELFNRSTTLSVALQGVFVQAGTAVQPLAALSFVAPGGFVQLRADEGVGPDHLDFRLPASGTILALVDATGVETERVTYGYQSEGVSRGRFPDGAANLFDFPGSASPGAANYRLMYTGPVLNEILARNQSAVTNTLRRVADWVELYNPATSNFNVAGMSLSVDTLEPGQWRFPANTAIPGKSYLVVWCDGELPATTNAASVLNTGHSLDGASGSVCLFNAAGQLVNSIEYGWQVADQTIGLAGGQWRLLASPTPGATNSATAALGAVTGLRLNEWMANPDGEDDWFELYNTDGLPVDLQGLVVTDDPSVHGRTNHAFAPLSFIGPRDWVRVEASGHPGQGCNHAGFSLDAAGELLRIYAGTTLIDSVSFGRQRNGVSQGRLLDGEATVMEFANTPTPGRANHLAAEILITEVLAHTEPPLEDAIELHNPGASAVDVSGWFLSDSERNLRKFRIPDGTLMPARGYTVFYEHQFNDGSANAFALNSAYGGTVWLAAADNAGNLTGPRSAAAFGPSENGVAIGRHVTPFAVEFVAMGQRSFGMDAAATVEQFRTGTGLANPGPRISPVVIHELMYHPPDLQVGGAASENTRDEYVELHNLSGQAVALYDPVRPTNTWRLRGGVDFEFRAGVTLAAGSFLLLVGFDPVADPVSLANFRAVYGLSPTVPVHGPYRGRLSNDGESIRLLKPDTPQPPSTPDAGHVPYVVMDQVDYLDATPWPAGAVDGGGLSLQKSAPALYGNQPLHWVAALPSPGASNAPAIVPLPHIVASAVGLSAFPGATVTFNVAATGPSPLTYQWRFNGRFLREATNHTLLLGYVTVPDDGDYDVLVSNAGGTVLGAAAHLQVTAPPEFVQPLEPQAARAGTNVTFSVVAAGPGPLSYRWFCNGREITGATGPSLSLSNLTLDHHGDYEVRVTNPHATVSSAALLVVLVNPSVVTQPQHVTAVAGDDVMLSVLSHGTLPMSYRWRRDGRTEQLETVASYQNFFIATNVQWSVAGTRVQCVLTNQAFYTPGVGTVNAVITVLPDSDGDRLPDAFETAHQLDLADPADAALDGDGDGLTNFEEYRAGTDPTDPLSYLRVASVHADATGVVLRFHAVAGKTYTLEYRDGLDAAPWQTLQHVAAPAATGEVAISAPHAAGTRPRIYRLVTPKQ